jgi:hypothetical protein
MRVDEDSAKENGERNPLPEVCSNLQLESELHHELQLSHSTSIEVVLKTGDLPGIATAVDASVALRARESINRMVEHVVRIHAELTIEPLAEFEVLGHRHVASKVPRSVEAIATYIAIRTAGRQRERTRGRMGSTEVLPNR